MKKYLNLIIYLIIITLTFSLFGCQKKDPSSSYGKENRGGTGYGAPTKSELYIEDFYFLKLGTDKSQVELLVGNAHYCRDNDELLPVYTLANGDTLSLKFDQKDSTTLNAIYTYAENNVSENFFDILVGLGVLKSSGQESDSPITILPGTEIDSDTQNNGGGSTDANTNLTPDENPDINTQPTQKPPQGELFATGMYNRTIMEAILTPNLPRSTILSIIGKPNYYFSHSFTEDSYIIDCYNLNDGSKIYLDYGYERLNLRCAAVYKNGTYTSILGTPWSAQIKPSGYTRKTISRSIINKVSKNSSPAKVYSILGEPAWYEGNRGNYNDVYILADGAKVVLNFGSAHNKLTSVSVKEKDGSATVLELR